MKIWYGKKFDKEGTVYKRFITMTLAESIEALKSIRATNERDMSRANGKEVSKQRWLNKAIKREGNYMFLNLTQAEHLLGNSNHNTAIFIKPTKEELKETKDFKN